ncbi:hypothetical protein D3C76_196100 [compost metagenome]
MAQSKAKKQRLKWVREGRRNPEESRSPFAQLDLRSRQTKSKAQLMNSSKNNHKYKNHDSFYGDDGSFYFSGLYCFSSAAFLIIEKKISYSSISSSLGKDRFLLFVSQNS